MPTLKQIRAAALLAGYKEGDTMSPLPRKMVNRAAFIKAHSTQFGPTGRPEELEGYDPDFAYKKKRRVQ